MGRGATFTAVMAAPECGMKGAYRAEMGCPPRSEGPWYGPCCPEGRAGSSVPLANSRRKGPTGKEGGERLAGWGSQEGGSKLRVAQAGTSGLQEIYMYTGKRSARSVYIAERAQSMHGLTRGEMLQMYYKDRNGVRAPYQERDMRYDIAQGYLQKEGGFCFVLFCLPCNSQCACGGMTTAETAFPPSNLWWYSRTCSPFVEGGGLVVRMGVLCM